MLTACIALGSFIAGAIVYHQVAVKGRVMRGKKKAWKNW